MFKRLNSRYLTMVVLTLVMSLGTFSAAYADDRVSTASAPAAAIDDSFFPLMAWDYADSEATLEAMHDAGINAVAFVRPAMLDACQRLGLKAIVFDESVAGGRWDRPFDGDAAVRGIEAFIPKVNQHPAVYGYHLKDEPSAKEYPALGKAVAAVKRLAPGKWPYINLFPGDGPSYDKYVEDFINVCQPMIVSYDRYVLGEDGKFGDAFWINLAQIREAGLRHGLPFHNIVLTAAHWGYREVTEADLRLQTFGSLVYGARGLAYYKFCSAALPILNADDLGNFRMGPLDEFGEKTPLWQGMRRVNRMITNLAPTLLKLRSDDVYHIGGEAVPARNHGPTDRTLVKTVTGGEFVVGDFTHQDGSRWVLLVNRSLAHSARPKIEFNAGVKKLEYAFAVTGEIRPYPSVYYALAPGQGVLLRVTQ